MIVELKRKDSGENVLVNLANVLAMEPVAAEITTAIFEGKEKSRDCMSFTFINGTSELFDITYDDFKNALDGGPAKKEEEVKAAPTSKEIKPRN